MATTLKNIIIISFALLCSVGIYSCTKDQQCYIPSEVTAKMIYGKKRVVDTIITTDTSARDTIWVYFRDSMMASPGMQTFEYDTNYAIYGQRGSSILPFTLDPDKTTMRYIIYADFNNINLADTLTIQYNSQLHFISNDCGFTYNYLIDTAYISYSLFDSISILNKEVSSEGSKQHFRLYFFED
jgi:hypothetical protein